MSRAGYDVTLVATGEGPTSPPFPVVGMTRSPRRITRMLTGSGRAVLHAIRLRPAIVHLHDPELIPWVPVLRVLRIRVVFDSHEDIAATMLHKPYLGRLARRLAAVLGTFSCASWTARPAASLRPPPTSPSAYRNPHRCVVQNFPILDDWRDGHRRSGGRATASSTSAVSRRSAAHGR